MLARHEADILVIGGGAAGAYAAIKAHDQGARVLLICKGVLGRSGCSVTFGYPGSIGKSAVTVEDPEKDFRNKLVNYDFFPDQDFLKALIPYAKKLYPEFEQWGLYFRRTEEGDLVPGRIIITPKMGNSGKGIMDILRAEVLRRRIPCHEETTATALLTQGDRAVGAMAFDYLHGTLLAIRAKCVILATGHTNYFWTRSTGTREMCGNGLAMAYRAGAELQGVEIIWWHFGDIAYPASWCRLHNYPGPLAGDPEVAHYFNSAGEDFFNSDRVVRFQPSYNLQSRALVQQIRQGKARKDGGYFASYRHVDPEAFRAYSYQVQFYDKLGLDFTRDLIECAMSGHQMRGGVRADASMEATLPNLFTAGSVAGNYVTGIITVCYEAETAAAAAVGRARAMEMPAVEERQIEAEVQRITGYLARAGGAGPRPAQVKRRIREIMYDKMDFIKSEEKMRAALGEFAQIRAELLPRMSPGTATHHFNYDLVDAVDAEDMLECVELITQASLLRRESRGPFYREDCPRTDNANWLRHIRIRREDGGPRLWTAPVDLKYLTPQEVEERDAELYRTWAYA